MVTTGGRNKLLPLQGYLKLNMIGDRQNILIELGI